MKEEQNVENGKVFLKIDNFQKQKKKIGKKNIK